MEKELVYETEPDRGFVFRAYDMNDGKGNAEIEVERDGKIIRTLVIKLQDLMD